MRKLPSALICLKMVLCTNLICSLCGDLLIEGSCGWGLAAATSPQLFVDVFGAYGLFVFVASLGIAERYAPE